MEFSLESSVTAAYSPAISLLKTAKVIIYVFEKSINFQVKANFGLIGKKLLRSDNKMMSFHERGSCEESGQSVSDLLFAVDLKINRII